MLDKTLFLLVMIALVIFTLPVISADMQVISAGEYRPLYLSEDSPKQKVARFFLDKYPVTNRQFFEFVSNNPQWSKELIPVLFSESNYLLHWQEIKGRWQPANNQLNSPVTSISWFAAQEFCKSKNKRLPKVAEWEYVARASELQANGSEEAGYNQKILDWYGRLTQQQLAEIGQAEPNYWGVYDMHGIIWEWTEDFNSSLVTGESREDGTIDAKLFCGAGAAGSSNPKDYAAFMRFAFRSSLQAKFALANLGFRCASSQEQ